MTSLPPCTCGDLTWTIHAYGRPTHKEGCAARTDPWSQTQPFRGLSILQAQRTLGMALLHNAQQIEAQEPSGHDEAIILGHVAQRLLRDYRDGVGA